MNAEKPREKSNTHFAKHGDCYGCPMPYKTEPEKGYQRECVGFETKYAALAADAITDLTTQLAEAKADYEAAVEDMSDLAEGARCKHCKYDIETCGSGQVYCCSNFEYRGRNKGNG